MEILDNGKKQGAVTNFNSYSNPAPRNTVPKLATGAQGIRDMLKAQLEAQYKTQEESRKQGADRITRESDESLRQAYLSREQQRVAMPQQIALVGGGGVSESANIALVSQYDNNKNSVRNKKADQLSELNSRIDSARTKNETEYYTQLTDLEKRVLEMEEKRWLESQKWIFGGK